jgi:hypothetical protein
VSATSLASALFDVPDTLRSGRHNTRKGESADVRPRLLGEVPHLHQGLGVSPRLSPDVELIAGNRPFKWTSCYTAPGRWLHSPIVPPAWRRSTRTVLEVHLNQEPLVLHPDPELQPCVKQRLDVRVASRRNDRHRLVSFAEDPKP